MNSRIAVRGGFQLSVSKHPGLQNAVEPSSWNFLLESGNSPAWSSSSNKYTRVLIRYRCSTYGNSWPFAQPCKHSLAAPLPVIAIQTCIIVDVPSIKLVENACQGSTLQILTFWILGDYQPQIDQCLYDNGVGNAGAGEDDLFGCYGGPNGVVEYVQHCDHGCVEAAHGVSDYCNDPWDDLWGRNGHW